MVGESFEPKPHVINLPFDAGSDIGREFEKGSVESGVADLQRRTHGRSRLAHARLKTLGHLTLGLLNGGLEFRRELQFIFNQIIQPFANFAQFSLGELLQLVFNLSDLTQVATMPRLRRNSSL